MERLKCDEVEEIRKLAQGHLEDMTNAELARWWREIHGEAGEADLDNSDGLEADDAEAEDD